MSGGVAAAEAKSYLPVDRILTYAIGGTMDRVRTGIFTGWRSSEKSY